MIQQIIEAGARLIESSPAPVKACGIGFGGPVDFLAQRVIRSLHVPGWDDVPLPQILTEAFGIPSVVENDATTAAIGEHRFGAGLGTRNMVYYTVSTGIGGGIILDGRPFRGSRGLAGEVGHVPITVEGGAVCTCGKKGCLEAYCSGLSIARRAQEALSAHAQTPARAVSAPITARDVFAAADEDPRMRRVIDDTARYLGASIAGVCNVLDPERVVLGGGVARSVRHRYSMVIQTQASVCASQHNSRGNEPWCTQFEFINMAARRS